MLMSALPAGLSELDVCEAVASWLAKRFVYTSDPAGTDHWRSRSEIAAQLKTGELRDDCDGYAYAALYGLADHGIKARLVLCWTEPGSGANPYHAVCESESGYVLDNRNLGLVLTWKDRPLCDYTRHQMSGFVEFGEVGLWSDIQRKGHNA